MASGDVGRIAVHARARNTENGQEQPLGLGLWLNRPRSEFARHAVDVTACSTATEAVLSDLTGRIVFGVRLRYVDKQLLEVETYVVRQNPAYYAPEQIIPLGNDPWVQPLEPKQRSTALELSSVARSYFDSTADASLLPPSAEGCERRQNGALMPNMGSCRIQPGTLRFEQQRYVVVDELTGIVTVMVKYDDYIGMYLIKVQSGTILDIEVIGGMSSPSSGW